jgi:hypothetical protein
MAFTPTLDTAGELNTTCFQLAQGGSHVSALMDNGQFPVWVDAVLGVDGQIPVAN